MTATTTDPAKGLLEHHHPHVYRQMLGYVQDHQMDVLHDDDLYRHVRFRTPGSAIGSLDLVTWPGHLTVTGDLGGGWTFRGEDDMFRWLAGAYHGGCLPAGHVNPGYWAEKVPGRTDQRGFSAERFRAHVRELVDALAREHHATPPELSALREEVHEQVLEQAHDTDSAVQALLSFRSRAVGWSDTRPPLTTSVDPERWDDFDHHYLLACHAALWGVGRWYGQGVRHDHATREVLPYGAGCPACDGHHRLHGTREDS